MNTPAEKCSHPDCGFFKDGAGTGCRAMRDNACASERATEAGTPATGKKPQRMTWTANNGMEDDPDGVWCRFDVAEAWAEEARREAAAAHEADIVRLNTIIADQLQALHDRDERIAAAQRTAGGGDLVMALKPGYEGGTMVNEDLGGKITLHYQSAAEADAAFSALCNALDGQPVEEAAAQADGCTAAQYLRNVANDVLLALKNTDRLPLAALLESAVRAVEKAAAAPTAQPTPPDDERTYLTIVYDVSTPERLARARERLADFRWARSCWSDAMTERDELRAALRHPPVTNVGGMTTTPMCERKTDDIMAREGYQKTGYVLMKDDPAARICVSDQGAVSWFTRDQWNWLMHNRDHVEFQWPKPIAAAQPTQAGAEPAAAATIDTPEFKRLLLADEQASPDRDDGEHMRKHYNEARAALVAHIDAAIAAAREEGRKEIERLREELAITDKLLAVRNEVIALIPECGAHGNQCLPHAAEWIRARLASAGAGEDANIPRTAEEVVAFIGSHYEVMEDKTNDPADVRFQLTVHDLQSAFRWWFGDELVPLDVAARQDSAAADKGLT